MPLTNEVTIQENLDISNTNTIYRGPIARGRYRASTSTQDGGIKRFLSDNSFNMRWMNGAATSNSNFPIFPFFKINDVASRTFKGGNGNPIYQEQQGIFQPTLTSWYWVANREMYSHYDFDNVDKLTIGEDGLLDDDNIYSSNFARFFRSEFNFSHNPLNHNAMARSDQYFNLQAFKTLNFTKPTSANYDLSYNRNGEAVAAASMGIEKVNNHVYIVPTQLDRINGNHTVAWIFAKNDDDSSIDSDIDIKDITIKSSSTGRDRLTCSFEPGGTPDVDFNIPGVHVVGSIQVQESTYMDYTTNTVRVGMSRDGSENSFVDRVPYNFSGQFSRTITLSVNDVFEDMNLTFNYNVDKPLIGPTSDHNRIALDTSDNNLIEPLGTLEHKNINDITRRTNINLNFIKRLLR